ncbi:MAG: hypothetical protein ABUS79_09190 [Pseudomonadota bacterium]
MFFRWNRAVACAAVVGALAARAPAAAGVPPAAPATTGANDAFDDPKLAREWVMPRASTRPPPASHPTGDVPPAPAASQPVPPARPAAAVPAAVVKAPRLTLVASAAHDPAPPAAVVAKAATPDAAPAPVDSSSGAWPYAPRMKLGYRRFPFTRLGAPSATSPTTLGPGTPQSFESLSLDLYPISWYLRVGLSTQFGWESGQFDRSGDYFLAETASVGFQIPGRFTPFVEALAGGGYMRRLQAEESVPTAYWQLGIDAGVEIYFANRAYVSLAVGYLHPGNLFVMQQSLMSVKADTWSLKIGIGI